MSTLRKALSRLSTSIGLAAFAGASRDVKLLCAQRLVRLFAYGSSTLILVLHLKALGHAEWAIGLFMTLTLVGNVILSILLTAIADRAGRRRLLIGGALCMAVSGLVFVFGTAWPLLLAAATFGMISPSGKDTGPFKAVEESIMSQLIPPKDRSGVFAWYYMLGALGCAAGALVCGWVIQTLHTQHGWELIAAYRFTFYIYFAAGVVKLVLSLCLSSRCELEREDDTNPDPRPDEQRPLLPDRPSENAAAQSPKKDKRSRWPLQPSTLRILLPFLLIFWLDQMGSGLVAPSWQAYFLWQKFGMPEGDLGSVFMGRNLLSSFGNLIAVPLARRFGLVPAMLAGHVPASLIVTALPLPAVAWGAVVLVLARSPIYESDQAPRQAWLALILPAAERTAGLGVVNVWRELAQGAGLGVAGAIADTGDVGWAFVLGGGIKIIYDVLLAVMFWNVEGRSSKAKAAHREEEAERRNAGEDEGQQAERIEPVAERGADGEPVAATEQAKP